MSTRNMDQADKLIQAGDILASSVESFLNNDGDAEFTNLLALTNAIQYWRITVETMKKGEPS